MLLYLILLLSIVNYLFYLQACCLCSTKGELAGWPAEGSLSRLVSASSTMPAPLFRISHLSLKLPYVFFNGVLNKQHAVKSYYAITGVSVSEGPKCPPCVLKAMRRRILPILRRFKTRNCLMAWFTGHATYDSDQPYFWVPEIISAPYFAHFCTFRQVWSV